MAWILEPMSIASEGLTGIGPGSDFCPLPLALSSSGWIRFEVDVFDRRDGDGGHGAVILDPVVQEPRRLDARIVLAAIIAIEEMYD